MAPSPQPMRMSFASCGRARGVKTEVSFGTDCHRGADLSALWGSRGTPLKPQAFGISLDWFKYFLAQDPQLDWTTITPAAYERFWDQSVEQYSAVIGTDNPDLSAFRDHGGKVLIWHGWADQLISSLKERSTITSESRKRWAARRRLRNLPGSSWRPALAIAAEAPARRLPVKWMRCSPGLKSGKAPETLPAERRDQSGAVTRSRPLCPVSAGSQVQGNREHGQTRRTSCAARDSRRTADSLPAYRMLLPMKKAAPQKTQASKAPRKRSNQTKRVTVDPLKLLAERVKQARARRGMTRKQLARDSGVSERYLAQIESGHGNISVLVLRRLAKALNVSADALLFEGPEPPVELVHMVEFLRRLILR